LGLAGVLAQTPVQHVLSVDTLDELPVGPFGSMSNPDDGQTACLPYSSGTTGRPKGIMHSHHSLGMQALLSANHLQMRPEDVLVQALPLVHLYPWRGTCPDPKATTTTWTWWVAARCTRWKPSTSI
jgi:long-subunit acyl-CoA synthetase (AMP-forming)